jgi:hypothetical protein
MERWHDMFFRKEMITVTLKLFTGIEIDRETADPGGREGISVDVRRGVRLKKILKSAGVRNISENIYFLEGVRISPRKRIEGPAVISCLRPSGGG